MIYLLCISKLILNIQIGSTDDPDAMSNLSGDMCQDMCHEDQESHEAPGVEADILLKSELDYTQDVDNSIDVSSEEILKTFESFPGESVSNNSQHSALSISDKHVTEGDLISPKVLGKEKETDPYTDLNLHVESSLIEGNRYSDFSDDQEANIEHEKRETPESPSNFEKAFKGSLKRYLEISPYDQGISFEATRSNRRSENSIYFHEEKYLASHRNTRGTRVWNLAYLDEAAIYRDAPILYNIDWFWIRWAKKFVHFFQSCHKLLTAPRSLHSALRSAEILPLPILREASKYVSFTTPDGHVANHKNLAPLIDHDVCIMPPVKVIIHLYSNHTRIDNLPHKRGFFKKYLNQDVSVYPANPFEGTAWGNANSEKYEPEKWMKLLLKAARQLYIMLLIDSVAYNEYKHELYTFLWDSIDDAIANPPLSTCKCSMFYVSPFEFESDNISYILDDNTHMTFSASEEFLPMKIGPQRNAQISTLIKEYYATLIQLVDVMSRIHSSIDAQYVIHSLDHGNTLVPHLHSSLGRIVPSVLENVQDKMHADAVDYYDRKEEFMQENGVLIDPKLMPPARFGNFYPMIHFSFDDEKPSVQREKKEHQCSDGIRKREFGPLTFCGTKYFRRQNNDEYEQMRNNESFFYSEKFATLSALKLSAPLGPANASILLDIMCPCVQSSGKVSVVQNILNKDGGEIYHGDNSIENEVRQVSEIGTVTGGTEYAIFGNNCYAVWDQATTTLNRAHMLPDSSWTLSLKDRTMVLPQMEKQVKIDGWHWRNETRNSRNSVLGESNKRDYKLILEVFRLQSTEHVVGGNLTEHSMKNTYIDKGSYQFALVSPYMSPDDVETYADSTMLNRRILNRGQVLPCIDQCSTRFGQRSEMRFFSESCMCKVGVFTEMSKRCKIAPDVESYKNGSSTSFEAIPPVEKSTPKKNQQSPIVRGANRRAVSFQDPFDAISLLNSQTMKPIELPENLLKSMSEEINNFLVCLSNSTKCTRNINSNRDLYRWFRRVLDISHEDLPEFVKEILPHAEIVSDTQSPFKKNVICIPPGFNFHWNLQRGETVVDNDTVYAKSVKQSYRHMYEQKWPSDEKNPGIANDRMSGIKRYFMNEARENHFLFSHHSVERIFENFRSNHTSFHDWSSLALPVLPKNPFMQSVLPFPESISGQHDLSEVFHPFLFPRSATKVAHDLFLSKSVDSQQRATLMEKIVAPMNMLSFMKHISTTALGMYFYDMLHPDQPCTSVMYSDSRNSIGYEGDKNSKLMYPSFLENLPTKNDIFVTIDDNTPTTFLVPSQCDESIKLEKKIGEEYPILFSRHIDLLFQHWNAILRDSEEDDRYKTIARAFDPPLFLDFPKQSWVFGDDYSASKVMPLLQEVSDPSKKMILVNVYCPCEPLRDSAWTLMSTSCIRIYQSPKSTHLYAQDPTTEEYFAVDNYDEKWTPAYNIKSPVKDNYFGYMPRSFSTKNKFSRDGRNSTLSISHFAHFHPSDKMVIPLSNDQVKLHSPCPCASICEPLKLHGNMNLLDDAYGQTFFRKLFTHNFCQAGVTVMN